LAALNRHDIANGYAVIGDDDRLSQFDVLPVLERAIFARSC
jgi:hypothetical protein